MNVPRGTDPLSRWQAAALRDVELPSGVALRIRMPAVEELILNGALPSELRKLALSFATSGVELKELDEEQATGFLQFVDHLLASMVQDIDDDGEWQPLTLTAEQIRTIPTEDRDALRAIATRQATPNMITAGSRRDRGLLDAAQVEAVRRQEAAATVNGWSGFPGDSGGAAAGSNLRALQPEAVDDDQPH